MNGLEVVVLTTLALGAARGRGPFEQHVQCQFQHGLLCLGYAGRGGTVLRDEPAEHGRPVTKVERGSILNLIDPVTGADSSTWLRVAFRPDVDGYRTLWARRGDVVTALDLRPVASCWPVRSIEFSQANSEGQPEDYRLEFDRAGRMTISSNEHLGARLFAASDGSFAVVNPKKRPVDQYMVAVFLLDTRDRTVRLPTKNDFGVSPAAFDVAEAGELKGCNAIPKLDATRTLAGVLEGLTSSARKR